METSAANKQMKLKDTRHRARAVALIGVVQRKFAWVTVVAIASSRDSSRTEHGTPSKVRHCFDTAVARSGQISFRHLEGYRCLPLRLSSFLCIFCEDASSSAHLLRIIPAWIAWPPTCKRQTHPGLIEGGTMRSELVMGSLKYVPNRYLLTRLAAKATRALHRPHSRIPDTANEVLWLLSQKDPLEHMRFVAGEDGQPAFAFAGSNASLPGISVDFSHDSPQTYHAFSLSAASQDETTRDSQ
jgi:hypothetical protein